MSVFGYGKSYVPSSEQQLGPQPNPQINPMFSSSLSGRGSFGSGMPVTLPGGAPEFGAAQLPRATPVVSRQVTTAPGINFMPEATAPWETEYEPRYVEIPKHRGPFGFAYDTIRIGGGARPMMRLPLGQTIKPFENVLSPFNSQNSLLGGGTKQTAIGSNFDPNVGWRGSAYQIGVDRLGNPIYGSPPTNNLPGDNGKFAAMQGPPTEVHSLEDLRNQIAGMSGSQLVNTDFRGNYVDMFQEAANNIANAFANEDYRRIVAKAPDGSPVTQQQAADWLEAAYNQLISRLNDAYLL